MYKPLIAALVVKHDSAQRHKRAPYLRAIASEMREPRKAIALRNARRILAHDTDAQVTEIRRSLKARLVAQAKAQNIINRRHMTQDMTSTGSPNLR